jgi:hypothetical protein
MRFILVNTPFEALFCMFSPLIHRMESLPLVELLPLHSFFCVCGLSSELKAVSSFIDKALAAADVNFGVGDSVTEESSDVWRGSGASTSIGCGNSEDVGGSALPATVATCVEGTVSTGSSVFGALSLKSGGG